MTQNTKLEEFIKHLPMDDAIKQEMLVRLASGEEQEVKEDLVTMFRKTGLALSAIEALNKADEGLKRELSEIEQQAGQLVKAVSKNLDEQEIQKTRSAIGNN